MIVQGLCVSCLRGLPAPDVSSSHATVLWGMCSSLMYWSVGAPLEAVATGPFLRESVCVKRSSHELTF